MKIYRIQTLPDNADKVVTYSIKQETCLALSTLHGIGRGKNIHIFTNTAKPENITIIELTWCKCLQGLELALAKFSNWMSGNLGSETSETEDLLCSEKVKLLTAHLAKIWEKAGWEFLGLFMHSHPDYTEVFSEREIAVDWDTEKFKISGDIEASKREEILEGRKKIIRYATGFFALAIATFDCFSQDPEFAKLSAKDRQSSLKRSIDSIIEKIKQQSL